MCQFSSVGEPQLVRPSFASSQPSSHWTVAWQFRRRSSTANPIYVSIVCKCALKVVGTITRHHPRHPQQPEGEVRGKLLLLYSGCYLCPLIAAVVIIKIQSASSWRDTTQSLLLLLLGWLVWLFECHPMIITNRFDRTYLEKSGWVQQAINIVGCTNSVCRPNRIVAVDVYKQIWTVIAAISGLVGKMQLSIYAPVNNINW